MAINYNFRGVGVRISLIMAITSSVKQLNVFFFVTARQIRGGVKEYESQYI